MNRENQSLENDISLGREFVALFHWLAIGLGLLLILPIITAFPDFGVTYWHVLGVILAGIVGRLAGSRWVSRRFDRRLAQHYPEIATMDKRDKNRSSIQ